MEVESVSNCAFMAALHSAAASGCDSTQARRSMTTMMTLPTFLNKHFADGKNSVK
jgi:hypothetical protein